MAAVQAPVEPPTTSRTPVYFLSHGGPNLMEDYDHPAYSVLQTIGREITQKVKPKGVVVFSAHWQAPSPNTILVSGATEKAENLIYDFGGFPEHYYRAQYPHRGSPELAGKVLDKLQEAGIASKVVKRGLDHGVWVSFMCAFDPKENPLDVPIVQVSLFESEDPDQHYRLGQAIAGLRDEGYQIIGSGMAVHNLYDFRRTMGRPGAVLDYAVSFDEALRVAVEEPAPADRQKAMAELLKRPDARRAHPTFEHLLPIHIAAGAAGESKGRQTWTLPQGSLSWAQYKFE
ncbi:aromatic ring-opening dioxygenase LigB subunit [Dissoconium aciculare CBS 342.82]|uniref:Aromatic ring-opening dioxygenase LigB subunit n=1 Tax=Dissoconium aciculare CBS 342.82 TaxID=1314786 RepID=A0A6J3M965_9PEZI|nr:aromatic ring-opening dioxygenase LigB subunit [Dissoconium aciculare CBS 342.82]KAF1824403.1 aromatic ring-opening dioxygenase LigB subunit [Dissoconium aciculare CBS 342.82]